MARAARPARWLRTAAPGLRFEKRHNVAEFVSNAGAADSPERAARVQATFALKRLHAAAADGGVDVFVDPGQGHSGDLGQIDAVTYIGASGRCVRNRNGLC
jgi:hypothetical protein